MEKSKLEKQKSWKKQKKHVIKNKRAWSFTIFLMSQKTPLQHPVIPPFGHHVSMETVLLNLNPVNSASDPMQWLLWMFFLLKLVGPCLSVSLMVMCNSQFHALIMHIFIVIHTFQIRKLYEPNLFSGAGNKYHNIYLLDSVCQSVILCGTLLY